VNAPASNPFPNYHVGQHRLSSDERNEFNARFDMIMNSGVMRNGEYSMALAGMLSKRTGYQFAIPTDSGTSALAIIVAFVASQQDVQRVLVPKFTYQATYNAVAQALPNVRLHSTGWDLNWPNDDTQVLRSSKFNDDLNMVPSSYEQEHASLIITVGLAGAHNTFNTDACPVIEDACQDWLTKPHTGNHRAISFDPSKTVSGVSGGGAILTDDPALAEYASRAISNSFQGDKHDNAYSQVFGKRSISEVDAMHVMVMLETADYRVKCRRWLLEFYKRIFGDLLVGSDFSDHDAQKALLWFPGLSDLNYKTYIPEDMRQSLRLVYQQDRTNGMLISLPMSERFNRFDQLDEYLRRLPYEIRREE